MIEKKSFVKSIKRALETGSFMYAGQELSQFPEQLWQLDSLNLEDVNWWECNPISKIDISNNSITQIPAGIVNLADVTVLRMKDNLLQQFPQHLVHLNNLKSVDFNRNQLQQITPSISCCQTLVELNLAQNLLTACPDLYQLPALQVVYLNRNKLQNLPCLGSAIKKADLSENRATRVRSQTFMRCQQMQMLNLSKNHIEEVQKDSFTNLQNLVSLQMKENRLQSLEQLPNSQNLDTISLAFNRLTEFTYFDRCPNLSILILSDNKIRKLSSEIIKLKKLKTLDVSNNDLSDLPGEIGFITSLVRIQVEGNPLKTMRQNIRTGGTNVLKNYLRDRMPPKQRDQLEHKFATSFQQVSDSQYWSKLIYQFTQNGELVLRNMGLTAIDQRVFENREHNFKGLNFTDNKLKNLSEDIGKLPELKNLVVNSNQLSSLPLSLGRIPCLQQIEAKNNKMTDFQVRDPEMDYPSLQFLDLSANQLSNVPKGILTLPRLRILHLSYNCLSEVEVLWNPKLLTELEILDLSNNKITDISEDVYYRVGLNYLNIQNNNLTKIPTILGFMKLSGLKIDGNPLKLIKRTVIDKGTVAILDYLRTRHTGPVPQELPKKQEPPKPQYAPEKPSYPYETEPKLIIETTPSNQPNPQQFHQRTAKIEQLQSQIKRLQDEIDDNMGMNNIQRNQKKKTMQSLLIQRNKLIKQ